MGPHGGSSYVTAHCVDPQSSQYVTARYTRVPCLLFLFAIDEKRRVIENQMISVVYVKALK